MPPRYASTVEASIFGLLPEAKGSFSVDSTSLDVKHISQLPGVLPTNQTDRKELANAYNFAAYYIASMPKYSGVSKAIYLDTDVVVHYDISELLRACCTAGTAAAAVEDCSQTLDTYVDLARLREEVRKHKRHLDPQTFEAEQSRLLSSDGKHNCVFNRGILVLDLTTGRKLDITNEIERWMTAHAANTRPLYFQGVSQPPFLLALLQRYTPLDLAWNTRGLGRDAIDAREMKSLLSQGMSPVFLKRSGFKGNRPFLSPFTDVSKILHFNGKHKPWLQGRKTSKLKGSTAVCGSDVVPCATLWWKYISPEAERHLNQVSLDLSS
mmetsp:Transcript_9535/g.37145  ORF Transcript_9535/g.37145 Transcript_9535/m.37145 type:complete len:324 (-) Transcript_9535:1514-2485(-)